ncbi:MAG: MFS transporter [Actinomycetota bacterium]|nr:MFS transporter [Actinomycetota bacterium]
MTRVDNAAQHARAWLGRRGAFAVVAYAFAITMLGTTLPTPLYDLYRQKFGFSVLMITVIFATYALGVIVALVLFGRLSDEIGRRRALLPGLALSALSALAFLVADGLAPLLVGRMLSGLSAGIFTGTATATLVDLADPARRGRATLVATLVNMGGLGCGPLLAGVLSQYAGSALRLSFIADLVLLVPAAVGVWAMPEPVQVSSRPRLRPQGLHVPAELRATFLRAALAGFAGFAVLGLFTAVAPAFLGQVLDVKSHATVGLVVFVVFAASAAGQLSLERVPQHVALPAGCLALIVGMGLLALGLADSSLTLLIAGGMVAGFGQGLSFRSGLAAVNEESPADRRAEVASSFFVVAYVAISIPVVGEGLLAQGAGLRAAGLVFAGVVATLAATVLGLLVRARKVPKG